VWAFDRVHHVKQLASAFIRVHLTEPDWGFDLLCQLNYIVTGAYYGVYSMYGVCIEPIYSSSSFSS